jgi:hypothetical protein
VIQRIIWVYRNASGVPLTSNAGGIGTWESGDDEKKEPKR